MHDLAAMSTHRLCSECGSSISESSRDGLCPRCLIGLALNAEAQTRTVPPSERQSTDPVGSAFGNYEMLEEIGRGGMGVVYKARQRTLNRFVALKLTLTGARATAAEIKRFQIEAKAAATLQHPNIVAIHDVGEHEGQHYFSMDYIEGQSLAEVIRRTPLPVEQAARCVKTVAEAIHYAHGRGILHRDLKPHNVLIDGEDQPRITDFGLARQVETDSDLTVSGLALGTPSYMPPEQAAGRRGEVGPASDVYSLGAILYACLTGRPPFRADTPENTLRQVMDDEPTAPRLLNPNVPRDLETLCLKCLAKSPGHRYASAQALADDLGQFLRGEPILARPVGRLARLWRWCRRDPVLAGFSGATGLLLLLLALAAVLICRDSQESNTAIAWNSAGKIHGELLPLSIAVNEVASSPELAHLIASNNTQALSAFLKATLQKDDAKAPAWLRLQNWVIMKPDGTLVLRWPDAGNLINQRQARDYFKGATNKWAMNQEAKEGMDWVYFSNSYVSHEDGFNKFGVNRVILNSKGGLVGVLSLMAKLTDFERVVLGQLTGGREVVLVSEWDGWDPTRTGQESSSALLAGKREFRIVAQSSFGTSNQVATISHRFLEEMVASAAPELHRDYFYRDPLDKFHGWWLAGFARVPDTKFIVIYKTRNRVTDAVTTAAVVMALATPLVIGWRLVRRRANARHVASER